MEIQILIGLGVLALSHGFIIASDFGNHQKIGEAECDDQLLQKCSDKYFKDIGIPFDANSTSFLAKITENRLRIGKEYFLLEATSMTAFSYCLGDQFKDCVSKENLINEGIASYDAAVYSSYAAIIKYSATVTFSQVFENFDCYFKEYNTTNYQDHIVPSCTNAFNAAVQEDPNHLCSLGHKFLQCILEPFHQCPDELVKGLCENSVVSFNLNAPQCKGKIDCDF